MILFTGKPDYLILQVRTNDIANNVNLLNNVNKLFRKFSKDSLSTQLACSSIIGRKDKKNLEKRKIKANARLKKILLTKRLRIHRK